MVPFFFPHHLLFLIERGKTRRVVALRLAFQRVFVRFLADDAQPPARERRNPSQRHNLHLSIRFRLRVHDVLFIQRFAPAFVFNRQIAFRCHLPNDIASVLGDVH